VDRELYTATAAVLAEAGWEGLTLERVAQALGRSRVTLWRNGITRETLLEGLLRRLAEDYRDAMLPVLTSSGTPRARLEKAMHALCDIVDAHVEVLTVSDEMFHRAAALGNIPMKFLDPFIAGVRAARAEKVLHAKGTDAELADVLFNSVAWSYLHLRVRHGWPEAKTRRLLFTTLLEGVIR
jgi:AcrR family transcriptional regulator